MGRFHKKFPTSRHANIAFSNLKRIVNHVISEDFSTSTIKLCLMLPEVQHTIYGECSVYVDTQMYAKHSTLDNRWYAPVTFANGAKPLTKVLYAGCKSIFARRAPNICMPAYYKWEECFLLFNFANASCVKVSSRSKEVYLDIIANNKKYRVRSSNAAGTGNYSLVEIQSGRNTGGIHADIETNSFDDKPSTSFWESKEVGYSRGINSCVFSESWHENGERHRLGKPAFIRREVIPGTLDHMPNATHVCEYYINGERFYSAAKYVQSICTLEHENDEVYIPKPTKVLMTLEDNFDVV